MAKRFNTATACFPDIHYMVDLTDRLCVIKGMVEQGDYFTINRARQYGKTTILNALATFLQTEYQVLNLDFQLLSAGDFADERAFVKAFSREALVMGQNLDIPGSVEERLEQYREGKTENDGLAELFAVLSSWCRQSIKPMVLLIDEVDEASNNQVFLDFLSQLRGYYIQRRTRPTFQAVILAGVYDVKNLKRKFVPEGEHKLNSPWNVAVSFPVDMSFSRDEIGGMLCDYEDDYHTGMDIGAVAGAIYDYTSGYPVLVSGICKILDEVIPGTKDYPDRESAWTTVGVAEAVKRMIREPIPLFESMVKQITQYPELKKMLVNILFEGDRLTFNPYNEVWNLGIMFGYIKSADNQIMVANRIFEMELYNYFLSEEETDNITYKEAQERKTQFIRDGKLDMDLLLQKFVIHYGDIYADNDQKFVEKYARKIFLLYLKPVINGTGNYYIEAETRDSKRTDVIVDYRGQQFVIELKIWRGSKYNEDGERQLCAYLDRFHLQRGYLLTFCFNKGKTVGITEKVIRDKVLIEAVV